MLPSIDINRRAHCEWAQTDSIDLSCPWGMEHFLLKTHNLDVACCNWFWIYDNIKASKNIFLLAGDWFWFYTNAHTKSLYWSYLVSWLSHRFIEYNYLDHWYVYSPIEEHMVDKLRRHCITLSCLPNIVGSHTTGGTYTHNWCGRIVGHYILAPAAFILWRCWLRIIGLWNWTGESFYSVFNKKFYLRESGRLTLEEVNTCVKLNLKQNPLC